MRNYTNIDKYLNRLLDDVYPQPQDDKHQKWAEESIQAFMLEVTPIKTILDLGCGEGFCQPIFESYGLEYTGVALGVDVYNATTQHRNVKSGDFSFLENEKDNSYDLIYSRHSLEHSPMPLLTLMEWHRITSKYVAIVVPDGDYWLYAGKNHYFVLTEVQWENLFAVSKYKIIYKGRKYAKMSSEINDPPMCIEFWYLLEKI